MGLKHIVAFAMIVSMVAASNEFFAPTAPKDASKHAIRHSTAAKEVHPAYRRDLVDAFLVDDLNSLKNEKRADLAFIETASMSSKPLGTKDHAKVTPIYSQGPYWVNEHEPAPRFESDAYFTHYYPAFIQQQQFYAQPQPQAQPEEAGEMRFAQARAETQQVYGYPAMYNQAAMQPGLMQMGAHAGMGFGNYYSPFTKGFQGQAPPPPPMPVWLPRVPYIAPYDPHPMTASAETAEAGF